MKTLSFEQMEVINAGTLWEWLTNAWNAICDFCDAAWEWIQEHCTIKVEDGRFWVVSQLEF